MLHRYAIPERLSGDWLSKTVMALGEIPENLSGEFYTLGFLFIYQLYKQAAHLLCT